MNSWLSELLIIDRSDAKEQEVWYSFALDELLCKQVAEHKKVICHLWTHPSAVILGQRDSRLPYVKDAIEMLERKSYQTCIRHSGGAAVPLDPQVLNVSLIFPLGVLSERSYNDGFEKMFELIKAICGNMPYKIDKGEIIGAYCPGDYDLSVNGRKFCGIAQRRKVNAYIVQAFINIDGNSIARAQLIKDFYNMATKENSQFDYPHILPKSVTSLSEFGSFTLMEKTESEVQGFVMALQRVVEQAKHQFEINEKESVVQLPTLNEIERQINTLQQRYKL